MAGGADAGKLGVRRRKSGPQQPLAVQSCQIHIVFRPLGLDIGLRVRPQGGPHGFRHIAVRLKAAPADAGPQSCQQVLRPGTVGFCHGLDGLGGDPGGTAPPARVSGADGLPDGVVQQNGAAVGGKDRQGQVWHVGDEGVHVRIVPGTGDAFSSVLLRDPADVVGMGLLAQHRPVLIQPQNGEEAAVVFPEGFRAVPLVGAEIQAVPRGGGHAPQTGGKAVGNGI